MTANFLNLPSRALHDYYRVIKHPVCIKSVRKLVLGIKGRDAPTGKTLLKSWDAFENEVSYVWRNAREYNEDGSAIVELAQELEVGRCPAFPCATACAYICLVLFQTTTVRGETSSF